MGFFDKYESERKGREIERLTQRLAEAEKKAKEPTLLHVPVSSSAIDVYRATSRKYKAECDRRMSPYYIQTGEPTQKPEWHGLYFRSCHEAFKACGDDAEVTRERALIFEDGQLFILPANVKAAKFWQESEA